MEIKGKIIALRGKGGTGKTTTMKMLRAEILNLGAEEIHYKDNLGHKGRDFYGVYKVWNTLIGITSEGDFHRVVYERIERLIGMECRIICCTCRTKDTKKPGTISAIHAFPQFAPMFILKTRAAKGLSEDDANRQDCGDLLNQLKGRLT
jgi:ABC-type cobalamin/Fe3+-siderophores transport system ATPase subunit